MDGRVVLLTGGHAAGKTTLVRRFAQQHGFVSVGDKNDPYVPHALALVEGDGDGFWKSDYVQKLRRMLTAQRATSVLMECTRLTQYLFRALEEADPEKKHYQVSVIHVGADAGMILDRVRQRTGKEPSQILTERAEYECTGARQLNSVRRYGALYPHRLYQFKTQADFSEQLEIEMLLRKLFGLREPAVQKRPGRTKVVLVTGGHASGKTTLTTAFSDKYFKDPSVGVRVMLDSNGYVNADWWDGKDLVTSLVRLLNEQHDCILIEGTRAVVPFFQALSRMSKDQLDVHVVLVKQSAEQCLDRVLKRRGKITDFMREGVHTEGTGVRQERAIAKYGSLYPHELYEFESQPDFSEQPEIEALLCRLFGLRSFGPSVPVEAVDKHGKTEVLHVIKIPVEALSVSPSYESNNQVQPLVINLRGTSGSGKTYAVRKGLLQRLKGGKRLRNRDGKVIGYRLPLEGGDVYVVGSYENECGGCDTFSQKGSQDYICSLVKHFASRGRAVIFEGLIVSLSYERYLNLSRSVGGMIWGFMAASLEDCLGRLHDRRTRTGNKRELNEQLTADKHRAQLRMRERALQDGEIVIDLYDDAPEVLYEIVRRGTIYGEPFEEVQAAALQPSRSALG